MIKKPIVGTGRGRGGRGGERRLDEKEKGTLQMTSASLIVWLMPEVHQSVPMIAAGWSTCMSETILVAKNLYWYSCFGQRQSSFLSSLHSSHCIYPLWLGPTTSLDEEIFSRAVDMIWVHHITVYWVSTRDKEPSRIDIMWCVGSFRSSSQLYRSNMPPHSEALSFSTNISTVTRAQH